MTVSYMIIIIIIWKKSSVHIKNRITGEGNQKSRFRRFISSRRSNFTGRIRCLVVLLSSRPSPLLVHRWSTDWIKYSQCSISWCHPTGENQNCQDDIGYCYRCVTNETLSILFENTSDKLDQSLASLYGAVNRWFRPQSKYKQRELLHSVYIADMIIGPSAWRTASLVP